MFDKISIEELYPVDYEEVMMELHADSFDSDEYFEATIQVLDLCTGLEHTILLSAWFEINETMNHDFVIIND